MGTRGAKVRPHLLVALLGYGLDALQDPAHSRRGYGTQTADVVDRHRVESVPFFGPAQWPFLVLLQL